MKSIYIWALLVIVLSACQHHKPEKTGLEGKVLPSFNLLLADSNTYFNTSTLPRDKAVIIMLFSPYCPYCRAQIKEMTEKINKLNDVELCLATRYPIPILREFCKEYKLEKFKNVIVGTDVTDFITEYFKAPGIPYTAIYGRDKKLNNAFMGRLFVSEIKSIAER
jgi:thiol-disulfide isomerase/thioredoxin